MKVWLTGGSGFLGRCIASELKAAGHEVLAPRSKDVDLQFLGSVSNFVATHCPIDAIIHSAAYYGGIGINQHEPANLFYRNIQMTLNVFAAAAVGKIPEVVSVGSACAYPGRCQGDLREEDILDGPCHKSVEGYGFTKRVQLIAQHVYEKQYGIYWAHPILTNLYGPHDEYGDYRSHVVAALVRRFVEAKKQEANEVMVWGDGSPIREFLFVEDAAAAIVRCLKNPKAGVVNIGTGIGTTIKELVQLLVELTGYQGSVKWDTNKPLGASRKVLDTTKAERVLNWTAETPLREGLQRTVNWYKEVGSKREWRDE